MVLHVSRVEGSRIKVENLGHPMVLHVSRVEGSKIKVERYQVTGVQGLGVSKCQGSSGLGILEFRG